MLNLNEQVAELNKKNIQNTLRFTTVTLEGAERLARVHLDLARRALEENARNMSGLTDPNAWQEAATTRPMRMAENSIERTLDYARSVYDVMTQTQGELIKLMEDTLSVSKESLKTLEQEVRSAPEGSFDFASAAFKSTIASTAAAVEGMTQAARQMAEYAHGTAAKTTKVPPAAPRAEAGGRKTAAHPAHSH